MNISYRSRVAALAAFILTFALSGSASAQSPAGASPLETLDLFVGLDGSKQPQDLGINANMGLRLSGNIGVPLSRQAGLGMQVGAGLNVSDAAVHVLDQIEGTSKRTQTYVTVGVFQDAGQFSWALGYDYLREDYYDTFNLTQLRGQVGYRLQPTNEVGVWFTKSGESSRGSMGGTNVRLSPISQANGFFRHTWPTGARTSVWAGVAARHSNIVWVLADNSHDEHVFVYGADLDVPLSERVSLAGSANLLTPAMTGTVDAFLGISFYPWRKSAMRPGFTPPLAVANNPSFAVDLNR